MRKVNLKKAIEEAMLQAEAEFHRTQARLLQRAAWIAGSKAKEIDKRLAKRRVADRKRKKRIKVYRPRPATAPRFTFHESGCSESEPGPCCTGVDTASN